MFPISSSLLLLLFCLSARILANSAVPSCTSSTAVANGIASIIYYVPGTGELCSLFNCDGGGASPVTNVPGCPQYSGTETITPSFLPGSGASGVPAGPPVSGPLLTDTSIFTPPTPSSFVTETAKPTEPGVADTTTTLMSASSSATGLVYDTAAISSPVTAELTFTGAAPSASVTTASTNAAAVSGPRAGTEMMVAMFGALAGYALL